MHFSIDKQRYSSRWGAKGSIFSPTREPEVMIPFSSAKSGNMAIAIKTDKGDILKQLTHKADPGLNFVAYDLSLENSAAKKYETYLNAQLKEGASPKEVKAADNGKYYLKPGKYIVEISKDGKMEKVDLEIVSR